MVNRLLIYILLGLFSNTLSAQLDTMQISGMYYNTNLYIYNPSAGSTYSISKLIVNNKPISENLATNGLEVDLGIYEMEEETPVSVTVIYNSEYPPVIVNPEALMPPVRFRITKPRYSSRQGDLIWTLRGVPGDNPIIVEQYKWNSWRQVAEIDPVDTVANNIYQLHIDPHSGKNLYRVKSTSINGQEVRSRNCILNNKNVAKVVVQSTKITNEIVLSSKADYEIYNSDDKLVLKGSDRYIDVSTLEKGWYKLFFDNQTQDFKKK